MSQNPINLRMSDVFQKKRMGSEKNQRKEMFLFLSYPWDLEMLKSNFIYFATFQEEQLI